jgi:hypothetical protein
VEFLSNDYKISRCNNEEKKVQNKANAKKVKGQPTNQKRIGRLELKVILTIEEYKTDR